MGRSRAANRQRIRMRKKMINNLTPAGYIWVVQVTSCKHSMILLELLKMLREAWKVHWFYTDELTTIKSVYPSLLRTWSTASCTVANSLLFGMLSEKKPALSNCSTTHAGIWPHTQNTHTWPCGSCRSNYLCLADRVQKGNNDKAPRLWYIVN